MGVSVSEHNQKNVNVLLIYRPPTGNLDNFCEKTKEIIQALRSRDELLVMGDFNIDYCNKRCFATKKNNWERDLFLTHLIKDNTRVSAKSESCIDLVFRNINYVKNSGTIDLFLSDHEPVFVVKKKFRNTNSPIKLKTRGSNFDYESLEKELNKVNWDYVQMFRDFLSVADKLYPLKELTIKNRRPDFINDNIIRLGKERDTAFKKAIGSKTDEDWDEAVLARRKANSSLRRCKYDYINENIENASGDPKKFWRQVRLLIPTSSTKSLDYIEDDDGTHLRGKEACNKINWYFCNISVQLSNELPRQNQNGTNSDVAVLPEHWLLEVKKQSVLDCIDEICVSKSSGLLCICAELLKKILRITVDKFTVLVNLILSKSIFPTAWKTAITTVIPKSGDTALVNNLRPISLIPITGKITEKIINSIMMDYLECNNLLFERQGGFRKGRSTVKTAYALVDYLWKNKNNGLDSAVVFIDIAKAFNT